MMMMMSKNLNIGFPSSSLNHRIRLGRSLRRKVDFLDFVLDFLKIWLRLFVARQNELLCLFQSSKEYQRRYSGLVVWFYLSNSTKASTNREMAILSRLFLKMKYFAYFRFSCSVWGYPRCHQQWKTLALFKCNCEVQNLCVWEFESWIRFLTSFSCWLLTSS